MVTSIIHLLQELFAFNRNAGGSNDKMLFMKYEADCMMRLFNYIGCSSHITQLICYNIFRRVHSKNLPICLILPLPSG
jgi:hypothetical protein